MAGSVEIGPLRQRQQSDLGDRLGIHLFVLEFDDLDDPTPLRDDSAYSVTAQRANEGIRDAETEASAIHEDVQSLLNEQHVKIELPTARRPKLPSICCHLFSLASVQLTKADKRRAANDRIDATMRQIGLHVQEAPANDVLSQVWRSQRTLPRLSWRSTTDASHTASSRSLIVQATARSSMSIPKSIPLSTSKRSWNQEFRGIICLAGVIVQPPKHVS